MSIDTPYTARLRAPQPRDHVIQLYTDEQFLARVVGEFLGAALTADEAAIVIATPAHRTLFRDHLTAAGIDVGSAEAAGRLIMLDAEECLAQFMVGGMPDRDRFFAVVRPLLARFREQGYAQPRLYGEMVDLLWSASLPATVALEELWNEILAESRVALLCAYRVDAFEAQANRGLLHQVTACHSELIPVENYERLERAVSRAYEDVFGAAGDTNLLRTHVAAAYNHSTRMPPSESALLGLQSVSPSIAEAVLERARQHYGG
jgi:hypothetical protein